MVQRPSEACKRGFRSDYHRYSEARIERIGYPPGIEELQPKALIIVIAGLGSHEIHCNAFNEGAGTYLEKPIGLCELRKVIQEMVISR
jgi:DNA-binding NtrC family response regulator